MCGLFVLTASAKVSNLKRLKKFVVNIEKINHRINSANKIIETDVPAYMIDLPEFYDRNGIYSDEHGDFPTMPSVHLS